VISRERAVLDLIEQKYLKQLPHILGALTIFVVTTVLALALLTVRWSRPDTPPLYHSAVLVVFEGSGCESDCSAFRRTIGRDYGMTPTAEHVPLRYYDSSGGNPPAQHFAVAGRVTRGLTSVVFDIYGREAARWSGLPDSVESFEAFVRPHVRRAQRDLAAALANGLTNN
jgi:hypothetical protein